MPALTAALLRQLLQCCLLPIGPELEKPGPAMALNVYITKQRSSLLQLSMSLSPQGRCRNSFIAEGVTQGWGAVQEQLKE